jgi:hypothetical protein
MPRILRVIRDRLPRVTPLVALVVDAARFFWLCLHSPTALAAENLYLRKQLAMYEERHIKPRRATNATRIAMVWLSRWFDWRHALRVVQPETFTRWHKQGFRLFWRWKSASGRPPKFREAIPADHPDRFLMHDRDSIFSQVLAPLGSFTKTSASVADASPGGRASAPWRLAP